VAEQELNLVKFAAGPNDKGEHTFFSGHAALACLFRRS
jgi:hypothetical protein